MSFGPISTIPPSSPMATTDEIPYAIDMTEALVNITGGSVSNPVSTLTDLATNQVITLQDNPTVAGNVVTQIIRGSALLAGHNYRLRIVFTAATATTLTVVTEINVLI